MPRALSEVIAHLRAVAADTQVFGTLIQTEDLLLLCDAAEMSREDMIEAILTAHAKAAEEKWPNADPAAIRAEHETYRPYAKRDVDAILAAIGRSPTGHSEE
jgi:hypothetical protein